MILFGMEVARLMLAIAQVETECGQSSDNIYQLQHIYIADVNRILDNKGKFLSFRYEDAKDQRRSEDAMLVYWAHYGTRYAYLTGNVPTLEVLARIHNGGPDGWRNENTVGYWAKVFRRLQVITAEDAAAWVRVGSSEIETRLCRTTTKKENENGNKRSNRNRPRISNQRAAHRRATQNA